MQARHLTEGRDEPTVVQVDLLEVALERLVLLAHRLDLSTKLHGHLVV